MSGATFARLWRLAQRAPTWLVRALCALAALVTWALHGPAVRQLERNLSRLRPGLGPRELRRLSRRGMLSYLRYYAEIFELPRMSPQQVDARVRAEGVERARAGIADGRALVLALGHMGNWDLAGAWACRALAPVTTVAEVLEPRALFEEFVALREGLGMEIVPLERGSDVYRRLLRTVRAGGRLVPLLADRDLTARGVEVELCGQTARVAVGPAALGTSTGADLLPTGIFYERLRGARRRAAGSRWGTVIRFHEPVRIDPAAPASDRVRLATQAWVDALASDLREHPEDWHMLQKVFVADLDPERYARTVAEAGR